MVAIGVDGMRPYDEVVTHGWTLDENGRPMSKSLGNAMEPKEICEKWGADMLRIWVSSQDYTADVRLSDAMMTQLGEAYRKIRNTFRFALSNLFDFDPARDTVPNADLWEIDAWMLRRTGALVRECREWYANFEFHRVYHALHDFCTVDLSAFYFDVLKDRLYTFAPNSLGRRSAQTAIYRIAGAIVRLIAPTLAFTSEEVWKHLPQLGFPKWQRAHVRVSLAEKLENAFDKSRAAHWERLLTVRQEVLKALEPARAAKTISGGTRSSRHAGGNRRIGGLIARIFSAASGSFHRIAGGSHRGSHRGSRARHRTRRATNQRSSAPKAQSASDAGIIPRTWVRVRIIRRFASGAWPHWLKSTEIAAVGSGSAKA